ncbi:MAG: NusG domain II-containing protein [Clostridiales Family XIII bacterium]|nr:NusG domain II-containing protein [Clostridiales Family XIII bacterium]
MRKLDAIILVTVFAVSAVAFLIVNHYGGGGNAGRYAEIYVENKPAGTIDLREDRLVEVENADGYNLLEVKDGSIRMLEADCLSQTCVNTGAKSEGGSMIVCLPNRVVVKIVGAPEGVDIVAN